jgi:hypothetical protein
MKNNLKHKLTLATQTIRQLDADKLANAAGAFTLPSVPRSCPRHNSCTYCVQ